MENREFTRKTKSSVSVPVMLSIPNAIYAWLEEFTAANGHKTANEAAVQIIRERSQQEQSKEPAQANAA